MRKLYTMVLSVILVMGLGFNSIAQNNGGTEAKLTQGKWVNHAGGYIPNPVG
jgi:oxaloacetate decarboxylase beta subunit